MASAPPVSLLVGQFGPLIRLFVGRVVQTLVNGQVLTSWYRDPLANAAAGGDKESQHLFALAIDIVGPQLAFTQWLCRRQNLTCQLETDENGTVHLHIQLFPRGALARAGVTFPRLPTVATAAAPGPTRA